MADGPSDRPPNEPQSLEDLKREITCSMCHRHYERAKLLPCNHYYCQRCIECLVKDSLFRSVDCPKCRKTTNLPHNSAEGLDDTLVRFVDRKVQVYDKMAAARGEKEPKCGQCDEGGRATAFCRDASCADFICVNCEKLHKSLKVFYGHKVVSLAELAEGGVKAVPIKETPLPKCPDHDGKEMELYCRHCDRLICAFCVTYEHHAHKDKTGFLSKCAAATRETLRQSLKPLQSLHAQIYTAETALSAEEAKVHAQKEVLLKSVRESFQKIEDDLKQRKGELMTKIGELSDTKEAALGEQKEGIQTAMKEIECLLELVKQNAESAENQDLMRIHTQLEGMMVEEATHQRELPLEPVMVDEIVYNPPPHGSIPREVGAVFWSKDRRGVHFAHPKICRVGEASQFSVKVPKSMGTNIHVQLRSLVKPCCFIEASLLLSQDFYSITYIPQVRGRHDLVVKVNEKEIEGSPFGVFVSIDPGRLGQPEHILTDFNRPWGVAFDREGNLVVTEAGAKKITIVEKTGRRLGEIRHEGFNELRGVSVGPDGAVYVVDKGVKSLFKFDRNGALLQTVGDFVAPLFVKVIRDHLYVSDYDSKQIKILSTDCNAVVEGVIRTNTKSSSLAESFAGSTDVPRPKDLAEKDRKLFVCDGEGRKTVGVYNCEPGSAPISSFKINYKTSTRQLSTAVLPKGSCFSKDGHLYVVMAAKRESKANSSVYVCTSEGDFVASFECENLVSAAGIAIDEDGFFYVCDFVEEGKIFVF